ncbi:MAG: 4-hydroxythreonine-4-phosphate dehydrogenase PdxA [Caldimicrobium sp.]|nr:4-hydroxythreonine-4-phosphate dehydrogenase PdxA [Caldimicrobium sp.]MCX7874224.1 4-hydroxythreonine-4-phosphate dehydrogenase PdxA [Caldimicrobium sp.]MDW8094628.1 4-hydroxythreonine-4-phosphate dehydrogenase PdxA [Caldimicrobium sp.]
MIKLGITLGDPAGVNPEVLVKAFPFLEKLKSQFIVYGDEALILKEIKRYRLTLPPNIHLNNLSSLNIRPGHPTIESHQAMIRYIQMALRDACQGRIKGLITLPINKEGLKIVGLPYRGHTEWLANELKANTFAMAFYGKKLKLSLLTTHIPLTKVPQEITINRVLEVAHLSYEFLKKLKGSAEEVKIALCGLNPHAGEGGLLGEEEEKLLKPAVAEARKRGIPLHGPYPADSLFYWTIQGRFDFVISLYHDQGLIPFKMLHFKNGVNLTLGLPLIRTSPVHGTAYDIAGKGIADPTSFIEAVKLAFQLAKKW